jgi:hypothetical protein
MANDLPITLQKFSVPSHDFYELEKFEKEEFLKVSSQIRYYYVAKEFCDSETCPIGQPNKSFYEDDDHISIYGAEKLQPFFNEIFTFHAE